MVVVLGAGQHVCGQEVKPLATLKGHTQRVHSLTFSPDGRVLASASEDGTLKLWDVPTARERANLKHPSGATAAFAPDGRLLASGGRNGEVRLWGAAGRPRGTLEGPHGEVNCLAFSPDSATLAVGGGWDEKRGPLRLWNVRRGYARLALRGHTGSVTGVSFSQDGRMIGAGDAAGVVTVWEVASGKVRASLRGHRGAVWSLAFLPGGLLASAGYDRAIRLWEVCSGKQRAGLFGQGGHVSQLAVASKLLASVGQDGNICLWNTATLKPVATIGLDAWLESVAFSPDGKLLAAGDRAGTIRIWSVPKLLAHKRTR
jgi:WD40 repeat protein